MVTWLLLAACLPATQGVQARPKVVETLPRTCAEALAAGDTGTVVAIDPDGSGEPVRVSCDPETQGGGWTLVLHLTRTAGLSEDDFLALFGHNRFTDESWTWEAGPQELVAGVNGGLVSMLSQGALDIGRFAGLWTDLRMACSLDDLDPVPDHWAQVDGYATQNGSHGLLGAADNGVRYTVDPDTNSMGLDWLSHDNEVLTSNGSHYLCDNVDADTSGPAPQLGLCYTEHLVDLNSSDKGDSVVALAFGTGLGDDSWSSGFTAECGPMDDALQNAGTTWVWIR